MHISKRLIRFVVFFLFPFVFLSSCVRIDESMKIFFPDSVSELHLMQSEFSSFWWNFVTIEAKNNTPDFATANEVCKSLQQKIHFELRFAACNFSLNGSEDLLSAWAKDLVLRKKFDSSSNSEYLSNFNTSLAQGTLIFDNKIFNLIRQDPNQEWQKLLELSKNSFTQNLLKKNGFFIVEKNSLIVIPIQFQLSPSIEHSKPIIELLNKFNNTLLIGAHGSAYRNEIQVKNDLTVVSWISAIIFFIFIAYLVSKSSIKIILLTLPVGIAVYLSILITQFIEGSIHGLTLAFGSGIIGLALDYGLHGAFGSESKQTWISNFVGLLTTLCGVLILIFSGIPLIRQMMVFSSIGLGLGFIFYYILFKYFGKSFHIDANKFGFTNLKLNTFKYSIYPVYILVLLGFFGFYKSNFDMNLQKLSFTTEAEIVQSKDLFGNSQTETFILIRKLDQLNESIFNEKIWSEKNQIEIEGLSNYLPNFQAQFENHKSWNTVGCKNLTTLSDQTTRKVFSPFFDTICNSKPELLHYNNEATLFLKSKPYLSHLLGKDSFVSLFHSKNQKQSDLIKTQFPNATSITQSIKNFSVQLKKDLSWMSPLSLLLTLLILAFYYKKWKPTLTAVLPFFTGVGLYFLVATIKNLDVDLISFLGLIIVFGFSIDYGVFSTDAHLFAENEKEIKDVYSALTIAALTNILGFFPMLFAHHPVLLKLGYALFFGTLGTFIGTIFGVKSIYEKKYEVK